MSVGDEGIRERLRRVPGVREIASRADFDPTNPLHVDQAALPLIKRFLDTSDDNAFELLVELTEDFLFDVAFVITREVGLAAPSEELVEAFFFGLMLDFRKNAPNTRHFLARAERSMRRLARERILELARGQLTTMEGGLVAHMQDVCERDLSPEEQAATEGMTDSLQVAFHGLEELDRRLILLAQTDEQPAEVVADELGLDVLEVERRADEAVERLQEAVERLDGKNRSPDRCSPAHETTLQPSDAQDESMLLTGGPSADMQVVADLVYDLAKAYMMADSRAASTTICTQSPPSPDEAVELVSAAASRLGLELPSVCLEVPPPPMEPLQVAENVASTLQNLEGPSPRAVLLSAIIDNNSGNYGDAERTLRALLDRDLARTFRKHARQQLSRSLISQVRGVEALAVACEGLAADPEDASLTLNAIVSSAQAGEDAMFQSHLARFRRLARSGLTATERRCAHSCVSVLASNLPLDEGELKTQFGIG